MAPAPDGVVVRYRPRGVRIVGGVVFTMLALSPLAAWLLFNDSARGRFVWADLALLAFIGGLFATAGYAVLRCRVDATDDGLVVINGYRRHELAWGEITRIGLPRGAPFARLETQDGRSMNLLGIQGSDGATAREAARQLRRLHRRHVPPDLAQ